MTDFVLGVVMMWVLVLVVLFGACCYAAGYALTTLALYWWGERGG